MTEPDLKGLSKDFVLKVMMKCADDHDGMHCWSGHGRAHATTACKNAIRCTPENCREDVYIEDEDELAESWAFVHNPGGGWHHKIVAEMVSILEVVQADPTHALDQTYGCTHTIEMCYTNGTEHEWRAMYGVNEETGTIDCWMD